MPCSNIPAHTKFLFITAKVIYHRSFERATISNGSMANSRVVNVTLSTQAKVIVKLKFPVSVSYEKLTIFHDALEQYFRNRVGVDSRVTILLFLLCVSL
jgi:hypothetical protein